MHTLPLTFRLRGRTVLVIGGAAALGPELDLIAGAGARVRVVAEHLDPALAEALDRVGGTWLRRALAPCDLHEAALALVATDNEAGGREAVRAARVARVPVAVFGRPELSDFDFPAAQSRAEPPGSLAPPNGHERAVEKTLGPRERPSELGSVRFCGHNQTP